MTYDKPQVTSVGKAMDAIESSLSKNTIVPDSNGTDPQTDDTAAYQADE